MDNKSHVNWKPLVSVVFCLFASVAAASSDLQAATEHACGIDAHSPAKRVFAKVDDNQPWREYTRLEDVPELALGFGISAEMWKGYNSSFLIRTVEPGEDFWSYTEYCFNKDGRLIRLAYEVRTAWGWAFQMGGPVMNSAIRADSSGFTSTETGKAIPKPQGAGDVGEALKPTLYLEEKRLPFYSLLSR